MKKNCRNPQKRFLSVLTAFLTMALAIALFPAVTAASESDFIFDESSGSILKYIGTETEVVIPETINGVKVRQIGDDAFRQHRDFVTSITIPASVTIIKELAFYCCDSLTEIKVVEENTVYTSIDGVLFSKDKKTLCCYPPGRSGIYTVPDGVTVIGDNAFSVCRKLTTVMLPNGVHSIGEKAFFGSSLSDISIPKSVSFTGSNAFQQTSLTSIEFPGNEVVLSAELFRDCKKLTEVTISGCLALGSGVFRDCTSLRSITWNGNGLDCIPHNVFYGCSLLREIKIPDGVTKIEDYACYNCSSLTDITIPNSVKAIGSQTFYNCKSLTNVHYLGTEKQWSQCKRGSYNDDLMYATRIFIDGSSVTGFKGSCGENLIWNLKAKGGTLTISGSGDMTDYKYATSFPVWNDDTTKIVIEDGVTSIGRYAFKKFASLKSVEMPSSITEIGEGAFQYCGNLSQIIYYGTEEDWQLIRMLDSDRESLTPKVVFSESIPPEHVCDKGKLISYETNHPHYSCYECSVCGKVWHDTSETRKIENCTKCYPPVTPSVKNTYYFDESYNADGTITVEVGVNTVGCVAIAGGVTFDPDVLECLEIDKTKSAFTTVVGPQQEVGNRNGQLNFSADSSSATANLTGKVPLFTAVFRPKKQTTTTFRGTVNSACNKDLKDVIFTAGEKTISTVGTPIVSFLWGDVDGNDKVDSKDKVLAARYLAKWAVNGGFNKAAADFNKDGDVTSAEAVVLARYLAKWTNLPYPVGQKAS